jgi:hypothetical protein
MDLHFRGRVHPGVPQRRRSGRGDPEGQACECSGLVEFPLAAVGQKPVKLRKIACVGNNEVS